jgi:hypothetical protein
MAEAMGAIAELRRSKEAQMKIKAGKGLRPVAATRGLAQHPPEVWHNTPRPGFLWIVVAATAL